jgi:mannose-6-phosphate isomerase
LTKNTVRDFSEIDSFVSYVCFEGSCKITDECNNMLEVKQGETILIPAITKTVNIETNRKVHLLETYILK